MSRLDQISSYKMTRAVHRRSSLKTQINRRQFWTNQLGSSEDLDDGDHSAYAKSASPIFNTLFQVQTSEVIVPTTPLMLEKERNQQQIEEQGQFPEDVIKMQNIPSKGSPVLIKFKKRVKNYIPKMRTADKEQPQQGIITKSNIKPIDCKLNKSLTVKSKEFIYVKDKNNFDLRPCRTGQISKLNTSMSSLMEKRKKLNKGVDENGSNSSLL